MKTLYPKILEMLKAGRPSVLATIIKQAGPSPRGLGAKCLLMDDGSIAGTVGGGVLEGRVILKGQEVLKTGKPERMQFFLKGTDVAKSDMLCGGDVEVFLEPVWPTSKTISLISKQVTAIYARGGKGLLATVIDPEFWRQDQAPKVLFQRGSDKIGDLGELVPFEKRIEEQMGQFINAGRPSLFSYEIADDHIVDVFLEPLVSEPYLYVFGGGHVSREIVPLAARVGFRVVVIDDRAEFADPIYFPDAWAVQQKAFENVIGGLGIDDSSFLVIVTRGHMHDKSVLAQSIETPARYIGMIGSKRKKRIIYDKLLEEGFTEEDLSKVHSPIGLKIGAETPAEIAVSIVAELIQERATL
jgi:xanthine dehydrogenase accessory factor